MRTRQHTPTLLATVAAGLLAAFACGWRDGRPRFEVAYRLAPSTSPLAPTGEPRLAVRPALTSRLQQEGITLRTSDDASGGVAVGYAGDDAAKAELATGAAFGLARFLAGRPIDDAELARRLFHAEQQAADLRHLPPADEQAGQAQERLAALRSEVTARRVGRASAAPSLVVSRVKRQRRTPVGAATFLLPLAALLLGVLAARSRSRGPVAAAHPWEAGAVLAMPATGVRVRRPWAA